MGCDGTLVDQRVKKGFLQLITIMSATKLMTRKQHDAVTTIDEARQFLQAVLLRYVL